MFDALANGALRQAGCVLLKSQNPGLERVLKFGFVGQGASLAIGPTAATGAVARQFQRKFRLSKQALRRD